QKELIIQTIITILTHTHRHTSIRFKQVKLFSYVFFFFKKIIIINRKIIINHKKKNLLTSPITITIIPILTLILTIKIRYYNQIIGKVSRDCYVFFFLKKKNNSYY